MTRFLLAGAAAAALLSIAPAAAQTVPGQAPGAHKVMKAETRAEVQAKLAQRFARLDSNRDGFITTAEIDAAQAQREAKIEKRAETRAANFDPAKVFARLDANKDGKITQAEAEAAHNARVAAKGGQPAKANATAFGGFFARADANHDGVITRAEFDALPRPEHAGMRQAGMRQGQGGRMIETADVNKDGRVSLGEAQQAALQRFDRADLNHDGTLSPQERQQARDLARAQHRPS
jgi:Ca2+-binding EF-hand superfamily protein